MVPDLFHSFVDDDKVIVRELPAGNELNLETMKIDINKDKVKEDENIPGDRRTMQIISKLANSIDPRIQTTFEVPSHFPEQGSKMPYLDTKIWMSMIMKTFHKENLGINFMKNQWLPDYW